MPYRIRAAASLALASFLLSLARGALAQNRPVIGHEAEDCWQGDQFPELTASIQPGKEILTAKVYFRSDKYPDFYYVEMTLDPSVENALAILPKPGPETERVIYYVEAIDSTFNGARTEEYGPEIEDPCKRRAPAIHTGQDPGIVVGATKAGAVGLPPGFQAAGIVGFITAAGISTGVGGGLGIGTAAVVAGAAAAAGGVVVVATGGDSTTTIPAAGAPTTTSVAPPATTTTPPATTSVVLTTTATTSGPVTTTSIPTTTSAPTTTSSSTSTTTATSTTTTAPAPPVTACFTSKKLNSCHWQFDASCSSGPIVQYNWTVDGNGGMPPPRPPKSYTGKIVTVNWNPPYGGGCSGTPFISVQLTVVGSQGQSDSVSQGVNIDLRAIPERESLETSFVSFLEMPPGGGKSHGFIVVNDARMGTASRSAPTNHVVRGLAGKNIVEAYTDADRGGAGFWKFDFAASAHFVPGSLEAGTGAPASVDGRSIVFRLSGTPGERIRFTFELSP